MGEGQKLLNECIALWEKGSLSEKEEEEKIEKKTKKLQKKFAEEGKEEEVDFTKLKKTLKEKKGMSNETIEGLERVGRRFITRIINEKQQLEMLQESENKRFFNAEVTAQVIKKAKISNSEKIDLIENNIDKLDSKNIKEIIESLKPEYRKIATERFSNYFNEEETGKEDNKKEDEKNNLNKDKKEELVEEIKQNVKELKKLKKEIKRSEEEKIQE